MREGEAREGGEKEVGKQDRRHLLQKVARCTH